MSEALGRPTIEEVAVSDSGRVQEFVQGRSLATPDELINLTDEVIAFTSDTWPLKIALTSPTAYQYALAYLPPDRPPQHISEWIRKRGRTEQSETNQPKEQSKPEGKNRNRERNRSDKKRNFNQRTAQKRAKFLHPQPREYRVPAKIAFARIRDILAEISYNYGDKWHVETADTQTGRITANLRFTDEFTRLEGDVRGHIHTRKERLQRFLTADIQVQATERGTMAIIMDFRPTVEGANYAACDSIISSLTANIESALGSAVSER